MCSAPSSTGSRTSWAPSSCSRTRTRRAAAAAARASRSDPSLPLVTFVLPGGERRAVAGPDGAGLLEAARVDGFDGEGAGGGQRACPPCHVHVDEDWIARLPPPSPEEEDMLDFA